MDRITVLKNKLESDIYSSEQSLFAEFIDKISEKSFDFILNNFDFIGVHKSGAVPSGKKGLTFCYGDRRIKRKLPIEIQIDNIKYYNDFLSPDDGDHIAVKFYNDYGIVAVADVLGNLYCNDLHHFSDEDDCKAHLLFDKLIDKYRKIEFPIVYLSEQYLNCKLSELQSIVKDYKVNIEIVKTTIDKKDIVNAFRHELIAIDSSLRAYYNALLHEKDITISKLEANIEKLKEKSFNHAMKIVSDLVRNNLNLSIEQDRLLIDCSSVKVTKLKIKNIVYDLPEDCQVFKVGTIVLPFTATTLKDCRVVPKTAYHPNIENDPCYGDSFVKLEDIAKAIKQFETINLDSCFDIAASDEAFAIYEKRLKGKSEGQKIWTL